MPTQKAERDFQTEGCNCNPYQEGTKDWEEYEQHFDRLVMEEALFIDQVSIP